VAWWCGLVAWWWRLVRLVVAQEGLCGLVALMVRPGGRGWRLVAL